ncbi:hypothetical protein Tco_0450369 [Tanacetum coccineum]
MLNHSKAEHMGVLKDVLCQVGVTTIITKFLILDMPIDKDAPILVGSGFLYTCGSILNTKDRITSTFDGVCHQTFCTAKTSLNTEEGDNDDKEDYGIQRNSFGAPMYGPKPAKYLNCNDPIDRALTLQEVINPFRKIYVWNKAIGFLGSLLVPLQHMEWKPYYKGNFYKKEEGDGHWHAEIRLTDLYKNVYGQGLLEPVLKKKEEKNSSIGTHDDEVGSSSSCPKRAQITKNVEEDLMDWNILNTLGCDNAIEDMLEVRVNKIGSDEVLFTFEAWKRAFDINEPIYTELCHEFYATFDFDEAVVDVELMMKKAIKFRLCGKAYAMSVLDFAKRLGLYTGAEIQEYGFETYFIGGLRNDDDFMDEEKGSWYIERKTLDANILRELIGSNGRLIPKEIAPSIPRVVTPRATRPTTSDLYDKIRQLKTRIDKIERIMHIQSYHSDKYARVLEHIASHYGLTLRDPYNPPNYFEQQQQQDDQD